MKNWLKVLIGIGLAIALSGCNVKNDVPRYVVKHDEGIEFWGLQSTMEPVVSIALEEPSEKVEIELPQIEWEADIMGVYEVCDNIEGERMIATSQLTAGKEYMVMARVLLSSDAPVLDQELDFLLELPTVIEKGKKSDFGIAVFANGTAIGRNEFAVTATAHALRMEYVPETYHITRNSTASVELAAGDVFWNEDINQQKQTLDYLIRIDQQLGVYEFVLSYSVRTEVLEAQKEEVVLQASEPMVMWSEGISQLYADSRDKTSAQLALNNCLRDNYFMQETMLCEGTIYMAVEVFLPEWAREYAEQYGLAVTWYNYLDAPGCGIGVSLPTFPDNLGHIEASFENLRLTPATVGATGGLMPYPVTPLSVWIKREDEAFSLRNLAVMALSTEMVEEPRMNRSSVTQLLGGEIIKELPTSGRFYVVIGTDLICVENDDSK